MDIRIDIKKGPVKYEDILEHTPGLIHGARSIFLGVVRNHHHGKRVLGLSYDVQVELAKKILEEICIEASEKWEKKAEIQVAHSIGELKVGEASVGLSVSTPHRDEAFKICRYVIDELKTRAPIWKKEFYENGETDWLKGHALCQHS